MPGEAIAGPRVLGILVTYRPGPGWDRAFRAAYDQVDQLVVWDNSGPGAAREAVESVVGPAAPRAELHSSPGNVGLPPAYNAALRMARDRGFALVLFLDQDSRLRPGVVEILRSSYVQLAAKTRVGAVMAQNDDGEPITISPKTALARLFEQRDDRLRASGRLLSSPTAIEVRHVTNSGTLLALNAADAVHGFDETLFVDAVDYSISHRLRQAGFHLFRVPSAVVDHALGEPVRLRILGRERAARAYPPTRSFHLVRDTVRCARDSWKEDPTFAIGILLSMAIGTLGALIVLPDRLGRARMLLAGLAAVGRPAGPAPG